MRTNNVLEGMLKDLAKHKGRSKEEILQEAMTIRLNKSLLVYYDSIDYSAQYLSRIDSSRKTKGVLKSLNECEET